MMQRLARALLAALAGAAMVSAAHAAGSGGCSAFDWPLDVEQAWFARSDIERFASGASVPAIPDKAIGLKLLDAATIKYSVTPGGKPKASAGTSFGGLFEIGSVAKSGVYQVTLSGPGWIDVVQKGQALKAVAHTGMKDCAAIHKSVRFAITEGPVSLQFSGVPTDALTFAIRLAPPTP